MPTDALADLRDIHLPAEPSWWPPALGWWLLMGLLLLLAVLLWWWNDRRQRSAAAMRKMRVQQALQELAQLEQQHHHDDSATVAAISALLKRFAMNTLKEGQDNPAALSGQAWLAWLDAQWSHQYFTQGDGKLLADAMYRRIHHVELAPLFSLTTQWLEAQR